MSESLPLPLPTIDDATKNLGRKIFLSLGASSPSAFSKDFWAAKMLDWSMSRPGFKVNLFRLVDVLPTLKTSEQIASHINEYLGEVGNEIGGIFSWGVNLPPTSIRAKVGAMALKRGVSQMASQFIAGRDAKDALKTLYKIRRSGLAFTVDLLGEYSVSEEEANSTVDRYIDCLDTFTKETPRWKKKGSFRPDHPGDATPLCISVKLSSLYSQCSPLNFDRSVEILTERLTTITRRAASCGGTIYVDAEDSGTNPIIYEVFKKVFSNPEFKSFPLPGIVVQAYNKSAVAIVEDLLSFARRREGPIAIRLVKGAYWDYERAIAEQNGWEFPLFTKKESTDANYERVSRLLLDNHQFVYPAFGSHNIRSLSHACAYAAAKGVKDTSYELQMLYGMAEPIANAFKKMNFLVRLYVPIGEMLPGMGYLVRRLLENTSNESFLRHTFRDSTETEELLAAPQYREQNLEGAIKTH